MKEAACFFSILALHIAASEGLIYTVIEQSKTWREARSYCEDHNATLASGNPENFNGKVQEGDGVFIGTIQVKERFWMAGCYDDAKTGTIESIRRGERVESYDTTLFSECLLECYHYKYIAVEKRSKGYSSCYCFNSTEGLRRHPQPLCGRSDMAFRYIGKTGRISVYEMDHGETEVEELSTKRLSNSVCGSLLFENEQPRYRERDCHDRLDVIYQKYYDKDNVTYSNDYSNLTWKEAFNGPNREVSLLEKNLLRVDALKKISSNEIWIGMFQETANITDIESFGDVRDHSCGLLKSSGITFVNCDGLKAPFICQSDHKLEISHKEPVSGEGITKVPVSGEGNTKVPVTGEGNAKVPVSGEKNTKVPVSTQGNAEELPNVLVIICSVLGVLLVAIIIIIIGVCCYLKRRQVFKKNRSGNAEKVCTNHEYADVGIFDQKPKPDNSLTRRNDATATDDGGYDVFDRKSVKKYQPGPQEDLYDHTRSLPAENNYDHLSNVKTIWPDVEDTYDHTHNIKSVNVDTEDAYDHTLNVSKIKVYTEDTYDHTSNVSKIRADTEDTYDQPSNV